MFSSDASTCSEQCATLEERLRADLSFCRSIAGVDCANLERQVAVLARENFAPLLARLREDAQLCREAGVDCQLLQLQIAVLEGHKVNHGVPANDEPKGARQRPRLSLSLLH